MAHKHSVYDTDPHFAIDPITREIVNKSTSKTKLIQYDHNSERFTFEIPRLVDRHDMSLCDKIEIHYINVDAATKESHADVYEVDDKQISPAGEDVVIFSWLIKRTATGYAGTLNFLIEFSCLTGSIVAKTEKTLQSMEENHGLHKESTVIPVFNLYYGALLILILILNS